MKLPLEKVGQTLRNKRQELGLRIDDAADEKISRSTISNVERGLPNVTESMYIYYAEKLDMKDSLLGIVSQAEQQELEAMEQLREIENVISVDPDGSSQKLEEVLIEYQITKRDTLYPFYIYLLGRCAFEKKNWEKAKTLFHQVIELTDQKEELLVTNMKAASFSDLDRIELPSLKISSMMRFSTHWMG